MTLRRGAYPGTFNPLTVAHLAIATAARDQHRLDRVDLIVSRVALGKENLERPRLEDRLAVLYRAAATREWLRVEVTDRQLLADIAEGYDVLVLGADKWAQVLDARYYGSPEERDRAVARLPTLAIAPRAGYRVPEEHALVLGEQWAEVSASAVRGGRREWMAPEATAFDAETGAWTAPDRYASWIASSTT